MVIDGIPLAGKGVAVLAKSTGFSLGASGTWTVVVRVGPTLVSKQDVFVSDVGPPTTVPTRTTG